MCAAARSSSFFSERCLNALRAQSPSWPHKRSFAHCGLPPHSLLRPVESISLSPLTIARSVLKNGFWALYWKPLGASACLTVVPGISNPKYAYSQMSDRLKPTADHPNGIGFRKHPANKFLASPTFSAFRPRLAGQIVKNTSSHAPVDMFLTNTCLFFRSTRRPAYPVRAKNKLRISGSRTTRNRLN